MSVDILIPNKNTVKYGTKEFWAQSGMIHSEDTITFEYKTHTVRDILLRLQALQDCVRNSRHDSPFQSSLIAMQTYIENMIPLCRKAQEQGRPEVLSHARQAAEDYRIKQSIITNPDPLPAFGSGVPVSTTPAPASDSAPSAKPPNKEVT